MWEHKLRDLNYNPFEDELAELNKIVERKEKIVKAAKVKETLTTEQQRKLTPIRKAISLWVESRQERTTNNNSVSTYRLTATWLTKYFEGIDRADESVNTVNRLEISDALSKRKELGAHHL